MLDAGIPDIAIERDKAVMKVILFYILFTYMFSPSHPIN
jgi:hypothetical protein